MQEYERDIFVTNHGPIALARLKVIRLPTSWYAVIWRAQIGTPRFDRTGRF